MPSVSNMMGLIDKLDSPFITVHQDRCQLVRNRNADCLRCASVCTSGCIHYDEEAEELILQPDLCIGCGTCATICPTCCLEAHHPNDAQLVELCHAAAQANQGVVTIACSSMMERAQGLYDVDKVVRVECLGRVEESILTLLASENAQVVLVHGECAACPHQTGWKMLQEVMKTQREILDAWNHDQCVRVAGKFPQSVRVSADEGYDKSKRMALEGARHDAVHMGATIADFAIRDTLGQEFSPQRVHHYVHVMEDGTLPHFLPDRRERLLDSLACMGDPQDVMISTRLWGHVIIDTEVCQSCRMCAVFCPTGALSKFDNEDGTFGVEHYPGDCVKCRCCENICPAHAIEISEEVFAIDMLRGMTDQYVMKPLLVERSAPHTIWNIQKLMMNTDQVYER